MIPCIYPTNLLKTALKSMNKTIEDNGLEHSKLVFEVIFKLSFLSSKYSFIENKRIKALEKWHRKMDLFYR